METDYGSMSDGELKTLLMDTQCRLDDKEDEQALILGQSQSGQHMSSKYFQSHCGRIEQEIEALKRTAAGIKREMESRKT
jgi:hypothetical protein